ncbi:MAG: hypothetical protein GXY20_09615 [Clostridiales bacterium]|nr:hypothetical protein [Clostridiales bacterium]
MPEKIFTIAINDAFSLQEGCPMCYLKNKLEESTLSYALGAAMMDPDIRIKMNEQGFCASHFERLFSMNNKLALGLILESHLDYLSDIMSTPVSGDKKHLMSKKAHNSDLTDEMTRLSASCFICYKVDHTQKRYASNVVYLWQNDPDFKNKLASQPFICLSHAALILEAGKRELKFDEYSLLCKALSILIGEYTRKLRADVTTFCTSFDHRNASKPLGDEKYSIDKAIKLLR